MGLIDKDVLSLWRWQNNPKWYKDTTWTGLAGSPLSGYSQALELSLPTPCTLCRQTCPDREAGPCALVPVKSPARKRSDFGLISGHRFCGKTQAF